MVNNHREEQNYPFCDFHPKQVIVGVCALCLKERLVILASKQGNLTTTLPNKHSSSSSVIHDHKTSSHHNAFHSKSTLSLKIFALRSFLHRHLEFRSNKSSNDFGGVNYYDDEGYTSTSQEDSFISIKFQDNGVASWDKGTKDSKEETLEKLSTHHKNILSNKETKIQGPSANKTKSSVVEHVKPHAMLRWRKRIGQLFQIMRWKRSNNKSNVNHVMINKVSSGGVKMRKGTWIRTLTKRR